MVTKKQPPKQLKRDKFFDFLQEDMDDKVKTITESVNNNNEEIAYLKKNLVSVGNNLDSVQEQLLVLRDELSKFNKEYKSEVNRLYNLILILMIAVALIAVNIFISVIK